MARKLKFFSVGLLAVASALAAGCQDDGVPVSIGDGNEQPLFTELAGFNPCFDGHAAHGSSNCTSCAGSDFSFSTTASAATVKEDLNQSDLCGESQAVFIFNTSSLGSKCQIQSATLTFKVKSLLGLDVDQVQFRIYSKTIAAACQNSLNSDDFVGCGSGYTDLGLVTINGTGTVNFPVPNPNTNIAGISGDLGPRGTKFVIVDQSVFSSGVGYQETQIFTVESSASNRPVLNVVTYDCFNPCVDGNVLHDFETACNECASEFFDVFDDDAEAISLEHVEPNSGGCANYASGAMYFDTASLDGRNIATATLIFKVNLTLYEGVSNPQIRIYAHPSVSDCPDGVSQEDFPACNEDLVSLGVVSITGPGIHTFTIPNPNTYVNREGVTGLVLADASTIEFLPGGGGLAATAIASNDDALTRFRPRLQVQY